MRVVFQIFPNNQINPEQWLWHFKPFLSQICSWNMFKKLRLFSCAPAVREPGADRRDLVRLRPLHHPARPRCRPRTLHAEQTHWSR